MPIREKEQAALPFVSRIMRRYKWTFCLAGLLCLAACSTKKNNFFTRNYHNLTSYYNVYWNGVEALKEVETTIKENVTENYYEVLPVLKTGTDRDTSLTSKLTQRVIEKAMLAVKKHSIIERGVEYVKYIDDAYLLMAKGMFYRRDFSGSRMVLNMVMSDFPKNPERFEAMLWSARTYIQEGEYDMAVGFLSLVAHQPSKELRKETRLLLPQVQAEYFLFQEEYDRAEHYLQESLKLIKNRDQKARILFILGQLAQRKGLNAEANDYYKACMKLNPPLAMSFNATLNRALCYDPDKFKADDIIKILQRLLKDPKNSAYFGRIYYVLGEIAFTDGDEKLGVDYMNLSLDASAGEPDRMLLAAKKLAEYYYAKADYIAAERYYAMAAQNVAEDDEDHYTITSRSKYLTELVSYYRVLGKADTVKMLYNMNKKERLAYGEQRVEIYKKQQEEAKRKAAEAAAASGSSTTPSSSASTWYFYNTQARNTGYNDFVRKWGRRALEDLWCFSAKPPVTALRAPQDETAMEEQIGSSSEEAKKDLTPEDPEYYLVNIPKTDMAMRPYDSTIEQALYYVGLVYFDRLGEDRQGEPYFLRLIEEYPRSAYIPSAYENLCKIYHKRKDEEKYRRYADLLKQRYPGTEQDKRINDPDYANKLAASDKDVQSLYEQAYAYFSSNRFGEMMNIINQIENRYPVNTFKPQLMFLRAVGLAHTSGYEEMMALLENFKNSYPDHALTERIDVLLDRARREVLKNPRPEKPEEQVIETETDVLADGAETSAEESDAKLSETKPSDVLPKREFKPQDLHAPHYVVFICAKKKLNVRAMRVRFEDVNRKFYGDWDLKLSTEDFGENDLAFVVSGFRDMDRASDYVKNVSGNSYLFSSVKPEDGFFGEISEENYEILHKSQDLPAYREYYEKKYQK